MSLIANTAGYTNGTSHTSSNIDTTGAKFIAVVVTNYNNATASISDSKGNTWQALTLRSSAGPYHQRIFYCINPTVGSGHNFTSTSSATTWNLVHVLAFSDAIDSFAAENGGAPSNGASLQPGSVSPASKSLIVSAVMGTGTSDTISIDSGFTITNQQTSSFEKTAAAYKIQSAVAAENPTWSTTGTFTSPVTTIAAFLLAVPDITTTTLPNGIIDTPYSQTLGVTGGTGSITWSVISGALPTGLSLNASTGEISGTPTTLGAFSFTVEAEDTLSATDTQALSITIASAPPVIGTDGNEYHKFAIPCSVKEYDEEIGFSVVRNSLSDGYRSRALYGSNTGLRGFKLTMPTLAGSSNSGLVTGINGEEVTKEEYLWSLYCECEATGKQFVIESQRNNQYYLVEFVNERLSYSRFLTKLYSTGVDLTQVRIDGVSVFQPSRVNGLYGYWDADTDLDSNDWDGTDGSSVVTFTKSGDVIDVAAAVNGHQIKRLNNTTNNGEIVFSSVGVETIYDVIVAMKMREATFSNDAAIFCNSPDAAHIKGDSGTTKFTDPGLANFSYFLNGAEYASDNMQAPMNTWGVCHFRNLDGWDVNDGLKIGSDSTSAFAEMDLGDVVILQTPSMQTCREIVEQMMVKYL